MPFELTQDEAEFLIRLARRAIIDFLRTGRRIPAPTEIPKKFTDKHGVFVTLNSVRTGSPELRGCIGYPEPILPLTEATIDSAINAATRDPRFPSVSHEELDSIIIEVSVLTPPQLIEVEDPRDYPSKILVGRDGLVVQRGWFKGLLLPQVPVEWQWDEEEFLAHCCLKAGLQPDMWLVEGTKIHTFSCIIIKELTPKGEVAFRDMRKGQK